MSEKLGLFHPLVYRVIIIYVYILDFKKMCRKSHFTFIGLQHEFFTFVYVGYKFLITKAMYNLKDIHTIRWIFHITSRIFLIRHCFVIDSKAVS